MVLGKGTRGRGRESRVPGKRNERWRERKEWTWEKQMTGRGETCGVLGKRNER